MACDAMTVAAVASADERIEGPGRRQMIERIHGMGGVAEEQSALAEVVQQERGQHDREPGDPDGPTAEVAHVRVERLAAGDHQEHRAQDQEAVDPVLRKEADGMPRVDGRQDLGRARERGDPEQRDDGEPGDRDRPEHGTDRPGAAALQREQADEHGDRQRDDEAVERRRRDRQALDRAQHRDRRGDHAVAVEERGAEQPEQQERVRRLALDADRQRHQSEDAALALVVGAQHEDQVLDRDDEDQRPGDERQDAEDIGRGRGDAVRPVEALSQRIERARADIAVDDAERREHRRGERGAAFGTAGLGAWRRERAWWRRGHGGRGRARVEPG